MIAESDILATLLGSVALLLWGVRMVRTGMTRAFGGTLRQVLAASSQNRLTAFGSGVAVTGLVQSSTATALLLASFAGRGLVALPVALAVMLGADVGTALAAQVLSFDIKWIWALLAFAGFILFQAAGTERPKATGRIMIGLALMLLALTLIGGVGKTLRENWLFAMVLSALAGHAIVAVVFGAFITWLAHSSLSMFLFVMSLASSGVLPTSLALALVVGANIGGGFAPFAALTGSAPVARQVPLGNLLMKIAGGLLVLPFLGIAEQLLTHVQADPGRITINFHTAFNIALAILFLPLVNIVATAARRILPEVVEAETDAGRPRHLDPNVIAEPSEALACAMRETLVMGDQVSSMLRQALVVIEGNDNKLAKELEKRDDTVDALHEAIKLYLVQVSKSEMSEEESRRYAEILTFTTNLEHIGDIIDKNLMELAQKKIKSKVNFSPEGLAEIRKFHGRVVDNMRLAFNVFATRDVNLARRLLAEKTVMRTAELDAAENHFARLRDGRADSIETSAIHLDIIRDLKRINGHLTSVAYPILEATGELAASRLRPLAKEAEETEPAAAIGAGIVAPGK